MLAKLEHLAQVTIPADVDYLTSKVALVTIPADVVRNPHLTVVPQVHIPHDQEHQAHQPDHHHATHASLYDDTMASHQHQTLVRCPGDQKLCLLDLVHHAPLSTAEGPLETLQIPMSCEPGKY